MDDSFDQLRSIVATRTRRLIVWCGAGLSVSAGIPVWSILQRRLEAKLEEKLRGMDVPTPQRDSKLKSIRQEGNPWVAFQRLQIEMGVTSYREAIRASLAKGVSAELPPAYGAIWKLRPSGLINLNLDRLATRAFTESGLRGLIEFKGKEVSAYGHTLNNPRPFVCNLHGVEEDVDSWVFTQAALKELSDNPSYNVYISSVLTSSTVLFLGITADDVAVGGHLERLAQHKMQTQPHFWITDRRDQATDSWAERNGIRVVRYKPTTGAHDELIDLLNQLSSYVQPEDAPSLPVALELDLGSPAIEPLNTLVQKDPEKIRAVLNAHAAALLRTNDADGVAKYEKFSQDYDRAIHAAWYTNTKHGENVFLGYRLVEEVARGAFGIVFRALDVDGNDVAVKLLHTEIRRKPELLNAFRRGVRSMRILQGRGIAGMVKYLAASEIPATLVMEWIEGPNLKQVVESRTLDDWQRILDISVQLVCVIATAHELPERVLHRDIRPPNMIVSGYWDGNDLSLRVLDFDLSWHRGSVEKSVIFGSQLSGYLAPEQVQRREGVSTQHASVDSYGIGMTLFYMVSGRDPSPGEHAHGNWIETVGAATRRPRGANWRSLPNRVARLILAATQEQQEKRWDVVQIRSELTRLFQAHVDPLSVQSCELLAEELAARTSLLLPYEWNNEDFSVRKDFGTGLSVSLRGNEVSNDIEVRLKRIATESDNRNRLSETINRARDNVRAALKEAGWSVYADVGQGMLTVTASLAGDDVVRKLNGVSESLRRAIERMTFQ